MPRKDEEGPTQFTTARAFPKVSGWANGYRTFWLDPKGWGTGKMLAFQGLFSLANPYLGYTSSRQGK